MAALEARPRDLEAANALEQLYLRRADYANLVLLLLRKAEIVDAPDEKKTLFFRAAQLYEEVLEDLDKAMGVFQHVLSIDDGDRNALDQLERLYIRLGRWSELKNVYAKKAELATTVAEKKQMLFVLGQVYDRELGDPERAVETYSSIIDLDPEDYDAAQALDRLFVQTGRWYDLLAVLERQTELAPSPGEVVSLRFRIGELWREHLKDLGRAVEAYRQVLTMDPTHEPTVQALEALMAGKDEPVLAAAVLEPIYESAGEWDKVIAVYEVMVANSQEAAAHRRAALAHRGDRGAASLASERRLRGPRARAAHRPVQPGGAGASRTAGRRDGALGQAGDAALRTRSTRSRSRGGPSTCSCASLASTRRRRASKKRRSPPTVGRLAPIPTTGRRWSRSIGCTPRAAVGRAGATSCGARFGIASTDDDRVGLTFRLAQIYELALMDMSKAVEAYREVLTAEPAHAETRAALERMFLGGTMQLEIADVLEPLYRAGPGVGEAAPDLRGAARPPDRRRASARRCCGASPRSPSTSSSIRSPPSGGGQRRSRKIRRRRRRSTSCCGLARATHQWEAFVTTMTEAATPDASRRRSGATCSCGSPPASRRTSAIWSAPRRRCSQVHGEHDKDPVALASLDRIYDSQGMYENLAGILRQRIATTDDTAELVKLQLRLGRVYGEALDEVDPAIASYLAVLEHESRSPEALDALERLYFRSERWRELYGIYEKMVDVAADEMGMADCYARMAKIAADALDDREPRRWSCGVGWSTCAARTPSRCPGSPISTRWPASGRS